MRLPEDAAREFSGIELDRTKPVRFTLDGRTIEGFAGDTVLSAVLGAGIYAYGTLDDAPIGLGDRFAPMIASVDGTALPMDRLLAVNGSSYATLGRRTQSLFRRGPSLGHRLGGRPVAPWLGVRASETLSIDLLVIGAGVAGLSAADQAATAGRSVILVERRPWLGGDARYFGPVGDEESPATLTTALIGRLQTLPNVRLFSATEAFEFIGDTALVHRISGGDTVRGDVVAIQAGRIVLATGSAQRLPVFAGNRLPGVLSAVPAYNLAKHYGVVLGPTALVATQSNYAYRLALRLNDAGVGIRRIVDTRVNPQSRFVDFAKASGLSLGSGQLPIAATQTRQGLSVAFANVGTNKAAVTLEAGTLIVSGEFQPDLALWMLAGGGVRWAAGRLEAEGHLERVAIAGSALGYRSLQACAHSGRVAAARLLGETMTSIEDVEIGASFETPDAPTAMAPSVPGASFLDSSESLVQRPTGDSLAPGQALTIGDVTASVALGLISPIDAAAIAEERGAPGTALSRSVWNADPAAALEAPSFLAGRFGPDAQRVHLIVDNKRTFAAGALVYANSGPRFPMTAIGVIVAAAEPGGSALISRTALTTTDRFIVETLAGPSPARIMN